MSSPRVTIIMRTKDSDWVIAQALAGLFSQSYNEFELLVMDCGSKDQTLEILSQYPCRIINVDRKRYFPGIVLNQAVEAAATDIVVFQNSDVVPLHADALKHLVAALDDPAVVAAFGRQVARPEAEAAVRREYETSFPRQGPAGPWIRLSLPFAAMRKSAWREHPFYTDAWASEDTEWGEWARNHGHRIQYVPEAAVMHSHNYSLRELYGRRFVEGEADAFIYDRIPTLSLTAQRVLRSTVRDLITQVGQGRFTEAMATPIRRAVYHWAYLKGHRLGQRRLLDGNADSAEGQTVILSRHDK